jgi:hypothetical protein
MTKKNQVMDQMARPARGYERRRGTLKTNSHQKMWPVVGIVYLCCCVGFWTRVHICGGSLGPHKGHIILARPCSHGPWSPYRFQKSGHRNHFLANHFLGVTERWWTGPQFLTLQIRVKILLLNFFTFASSAGWIWCQVSACSEIRKICLPVEGRSLRLITCTSLHSGRPACLLP